MHNKTFYRSTTNKQVADLMGGLSEFMSVDVNFLRFVAILVIIFSGVVPGLIAYLAAAYFVPIKPEGGKDA